MPLPQPLVGTPIKVLQRPVEYSFWPMGRTTRRFGLQSRVFATDPWSIIRHSIDKRCPASVKPQAHAFSIQARDYFKAADSADLFTTKPVLLYYSFLNLAKAFVLACGNRQYFAEAKHGLTERLQPATGAELTNSVLGAYRTGTTVNIFDEFLIALRGTGLAADITIPMPHLLPQLLQGHRLWCSAARLDERFIAVARIDLLQRTPPHQLWLVLNIFEDDLARLGVSHARLLQETGLTTRFREVESTEAVNGRRLLKFEQITPTTYTGRPSDHVPALVNSLKLDLWSNVLSVPPYRKYYVYLAPAVERTTVLPQLVSIFALFYYLGSVTRYKPHKISGLLQGAFGAQLEECVINLPNQFMFLLASEFARQDVARAAIV